MHFLFCWFYFLFDKFLWSALSAKNWLSTVQTCIFTNPKSLLKQQRMISTNYELALLLITLLTTIIQAYVIFLVQFRSPRAIQEYRYFLNQFCVSLLVVGEIWRVHYSSHLKKSQFQQIISLILVMGPGLHRIVGPIPATTTALTQRNNRNER